MSAAWDDGVLYLDGEWDLANTEMLADEIELVVMSGARSVTLDMSRVSFFDSTGIKALIGARKLGLKVVVRDPSPPVLKVLEMTGCIGPIVEVTGSGEP